MAEEKNKISYQKTIFNKKDFQQHKTKSNIRFWLIIVTALVFGIILFGIRDHWGCEDQRLFIWEDYVLYILLTAGIALATYVKNKTLFAGGYFQTETVSEITQEDFVNAQIEILKDPIKATKELLDLKFKYKFLSEQLGAQAATIEGLVAVLKEKD